MFEFPWDCYIYQLKLECCYSKVLCKVGSNNHMHSQNGLSQTKKVHTYKTQQLQYNWGLIIEPIQKNINYNTTNICRYTLHFPAIYDQIKRYCLFSLLFLGEDGTLLDFAAFFVSSFAPVCLTFTPLIICKNPNNN